MSSHIYEICIEHFGSWWVVGQNLVAVYDGIVAVDGFGQKCLQSSSAQEESQAISLGF